ncbi:hypothetical protein BAOM_2994 [Peribacillus asahii]|uniref:Uncharacterized protein n=1 Tax=Peribacillus asahii TaxID=228899 RepID=A0A3T0KTL0_9BACI|nr:hypothetical protein [Peribacillus asahii]AZV43603.1 hypothetical protein BAOM_2994 [Peribacillus asahii]
MSFIEEATEAFKDSLKGYGASELFIKNAIASFITGVAVGSLINSSEDLQEEMINTILNGEIIN